jgi:hypothetical protein
VGGALNRTTRSSRYLLGDRDERAHHLLRLGPHLRADFVVEEEMALRVAEHLGRAITR